MRDIYHGLLPLENCFTLARAKSEKKNFERWLEDIGKHFANKNNPRYKQHEKFAKREIAEYERFINENEHPRDEWCETLKCQK